MNKKLLMPILGAAGALVVALLLMFPILSMEVKDIPIGVVSLDAGMATPAGEVNAGEKMVEGLTGGEGGVVNFVKVESEEELHEGLDAGEYYTAIVVPEDFTKKSAANEGTVKATINEGLHPMVTMQLSPILTAMGQQAGMKIETESINSIAALGMKAMLVPMLMVMMTFIISVVTAFLITRNVEDKNKWLKYLRQVVYIAVMAVAIGFTVAGVEIGLAGVELDAVEPAWFLALVAGAIMLLVNGAVSLWGKKGLAVPVVLFILGIGAMQMPCEYLNGGWQMLVASWEPFRYIGNGIREVLYQGHGVWNSAAVSITVLALLGMGLGMVDVCRKEKPAEKKKE